MVAILLATDGSEDARTAASRAIALADERDATLYAICVVDERRFCVPALGSAELATIYAADHADRRVDEVRRMAETRNVPVQGTIRHGVPHEAILDYADEVDAAVIVVGERGDHEEHLPGVGRTVADRADCEVLVVDAGASSVTGANIPVDGGWTAH